MARTENRKLKTPPVRGFTVLEVIVVIAMIGFVALLAAPFLSNSLASNDAAQSATEAVDSLREAQSSVMSGKDGARFGVHFEGTKFVLFRGAAYAPADPDNAVHALAGDVSVSAVMLAPGGACALPAGTGNCDVHFANRRGAPTESGTITFTGSGGETKTVSINAAGMIDAD